MPPVFVTPVGTNLTTLQQNFDRLLPMWVTSASIDDGTIPEPRWTSTISGDSLSFLEIVKHGSVRHVVKSPYSAPGSNATEGQLIETQGLFPKPIPIHLERIPFGASANLSGNFNFIPENFAVSYEMENGSPKNFLVDLSYTAEVNLLLEAGLDNDGVIADSEKTLFEAPIFSVTLPGGITFSPQLEITSGVTADFTKRVSIPLVSRFTIDVIVGMKDGLPYYEDRTTTVPLALSDPQVFEDIGASASVFLEAEIDAIFGYPGSFTSAGPTVGARLAADFSMNPLADPWWSTSADLEVTAGVEFDFAEIISLVDEEKVLRSFSIFEADAGGPLFPAVGNRSFTVPPGGVNPGLRPLSDPEARWSRSILTESSSSPGRAWLIPFGENFLAGHANAVGAHFYRVARDGRVLDVQSPRPLTRFAARDAVPLEGGGAILLGNRTGFIELAELAPDLTMTPVTKVDLGFLHQSLRVQRHGTRLYVMGTDFAGSPSRSKVVLTCLEMTGEVVWSQIYDQNDNSILSAADFCVLSDGNLAFCATTSANFTEADGLNSQLRSVNISPNGLLVKVDAATGQPIWSTMLAHDISTSYWAIAESPKGEITIGGSRLRGFLSNTPSMLLAQLSGDGEILDSLMIGHAGSDKAADYPEVDGLFVLLPHGGETTYDEIRDLVWTEEGLWVCGKMGIFNAGSVLSTGSSAFTLRFSPELHPGRFALHGGLSRDQFDRLLVTEKGPLCAGFSKSFHPWPGGAEGEEDDTPYSFWLHKLPWEGRMDFHDLSSAAQPAAGKAALAGSFYVYPRVVAGSLTASFDINQPEVDIYGRSEDRIKGASGNVVATPMVTEIVELTAH